jgi:zinc transport system ATP-binding protein
VSAAAEAPSAVPTFQVVEACVEFDRNRIIDNLDLTIEPGSFVVLLGANGSGKTTLVRAMLGLQPLAAGRALVHGVPVGRFRDWQRITMVPQRLPAATGVPVSVLEVVGSARFSPRTRLRTLDRAAVAEALALVGLADRVWDRFDTLSGGQQRRVMVARALCAGSDTLVLDEPTAGVDLANQQRLAQILADLHGVTVVMVAHGLGPFAGLVTRAIVLEDGRIIHDGPAAPAGWTDVHHHDDGDTAAPGLLEG